MAALLIGRLALSVSGVSSVLSINEEARLSDRPNSSFLTRKLCLTAVATVTAKLIDWTSINDGRRDVESLSQTFPSFRIDDFLFIFFVSTSSIDRNG